MDRLQIYGFAKAAMLPGVNLGTTVGNMASAIAPNSIAGKQLGNKVINSGVMPGMINFADTLRNTMGPTGLTRVM